MTEFDPKTAEDRLADLPISNCGHFYKVSSIVLEIADTIAGSLAEVFYLLEPVTELKETAETTVRFAHAPKGSIRLEQ